MKRIRIKLRPFITLISIGIGVILGLSGGPVYILIPWGIAGLIIGAFSVSAKWALINGAAYGFAVAFIFMIAGYRGIEPVASYLLPFAILGIVGAVCGLVSSVIGYLIVSKRLNNAPESD